MRTCLNIQQLVGAAERLRERKVMQDHGVDWLAAMEVARDRLLVTPFHAQTLSAYRHSKHGKTRLIAMVEPPERLIEEALLPILQACMPPGQHPAMHAYVPGRSTWTAANALCTALGEGRHQLCQLDIAHYFDRINRTLLNRLVNARLEPGRAQVVQALAAAPLRMGKHLLHRNRGIPQGRALSPFLANLYLAAFDIAMLRHTGLTYLRYGDDLLIAGASRSDIQAAAHYAEQLMRAIGLELNPAKTVFTEYRDEPVEYLGHLVGADGLFERVAGERLKRITERKPANKNAQGKQPNLRHRTLYITEYSTYAHIKDSQIVIRRGNEALRTIPLRSVDRVLVMGGVAMSSGFIGALIARGIPMQVFVGRGRALYVGNHR